MTAAQDGGLATLVRELGRNARSASRVLARSAAGERNAALDAIGHALAEAEAGLLEANHEDLERGRGRGLDPALLDRLQLTPARVRDMIEGLAQVARLADPVGEVDGVRTMASGIRVGRMRVPLGVVGIIYESRPNVTVDAAALCIKSGNAAILRGGSEAASSNAAIAAAITHGLAAAGLPGACVQLVRTTDRAAVGHLLAMEDYLDVVVPRGGKGLIQRVAAEARVPVLKHLDGVCHVYIDDGAEHAMAEAIAVNAKTHRYGVCNAMETLLVARSEAASLLPLLAARFRDAGVELRGCAETLSLVPGAIAAVESDWGEEYLAPVLSVRVVSDIDEAMEHIARYGSGHTDVIVTRDHARAMRFLREVDSSSVMINASSRFADGYEYGLGAEIGISTNKLHARGPVGLEGLTSQKYVVFGDGQVRS